MIRSWDDETINHDKAPEERRRDRSRVPRERKNESRLLPAKQGSASPRWTTITIVYAEERNKLVPVELVGDSGLTSNAVVRTVAVWLRKGRRVEMSWHGDESSMGRIVGLLERE